MIRPGPCAAVVLGLLVSTRDAWADNNEWEFLTTNDLFKLLAIAIGVVIVGLVVLVVVVKQTTKVVKKSAKFVVDVRREIKNTPELPEARVHQDNTSAGKDSAKD